ncbi:MAG TPA: adenosylcobalamin-dependent ribonucleoside-diphosphate reductase [Anaerolineaceae bacterium]|nr:adenosylcobalamin-dependent ribonucleoside-diphosphate reductase [Anaerolineaceae bacterium]HPS32946.1 adenosylcobalamin-dependent ribonucleoside-diphosphate reductase [Anaerolineaceae bacterium]
MEHSATPPAGLLPTPPVPPDLPAITLSENSRQILAKRYLRRGEDGEPVESVEEMFWRIAWHIADVEAEAAPLETAKAFYRLLVSKSFFPNSPTFTGAGTPLGQLAACFVLPISDDMGRASDGIFTTLRNAALIQQTGGGNGFNFSRIRPKGAIVKTSSGQATGPVGFLKVYDNAFGEIAQGGTRRGANMGILRVDHPDIEEFISCKTNENAITNFNISIAITDAFMRAVEEDSPWELRFPDVSTPAYKTFSGTLEAAERAGLPIRTYKTVSARELFKKFVAQAHHNGEPGALFLDAANRSNPVPHLYDLEATNPCGEQWLGPYENCCLGSVNLACHLAPDGKVDWEKLRESTILATRFLDHVVDKNAYVPAVPELRQSALNARRIGLGIMGLADLMYHAGVRYGSEESLEFAGQVMEFIRYHCMLTSIAMAKEHGPFPAIKGSIYDPENLTWSAPEPLFPYTRDWGRPAVDWQLVFEGIHQHGIRNAAQTTIAPTGTIGTVAGCEGYGCEPVFALAYVRHVNDHGRDLTLNYASPLFQSALDKAEFSPEQKEEIIREVIEAGSCQQIALLPEELRSVYVVSADIHAHEHIRLQAALQRFVDNSLSKTINFPAGASEQEVADTFLEAWKLGCKGITVYITGSREKVVLETKATMQARQAAAEEKPETYGDAVVTQPSFWKDAKKPRPRILKGYTYSIETPLGKAFITINENGGDQPFEVFINTAKAGSETAAHSEALGRLISYVLRIASSIEPRERLKIVMEQLAGIGGGRSLGFGPNRVRSLPDGIAKALDEYLFQRHWEKEEEPEPLPGEPLPFMEDRKGVKSIGELCPECGQATLINEEGCRKCYTCGHSEC